MAVIASPPVLGIGVRVAASFVPGVDVHLEYGGRRNIDAAAAVYRVPAIVTAIIAGGAAEFARDESGEIKLLPESVLFAPHGEFGLRISGGIIRRYLSIAVAVAGAGRPAPHRAAVAVGAEKRRCIGAVAGEAAVFVVEGIDGGASFFNILDPRAQLCRFYKILSHENLAHNQANNDQHYAHLMSR